MKQTFILLSFLFVAFTAIGQKRISEGVISYDIVINTGTGKPRAADFFDGATSTVYLKGNQSRTEMVSSLGTQSTIIDGAKDAIFILKEYGEQKYLIQLTGSNWMDANKKNDNVQFSYSDETKTILGYKCNKAIGTLADGSTFTVWYTADLIPENKDFQYVNKSLPGLAMEYESVIGNLKVTYTVSKITTGAVPAAKFDLPKSGYRILSYEESKGQ
jgi:GLPGLI family protein